jgi:hypothetical protein
MIPEVYVIGADRKCPLCLSTIGSAVYGRMTCATGHQFTNATLPNELLRIDQLSTEEAQLVVRLAALALSGGTELTEYLAERRAILSKRLDANEFKFDHIQWDRPIPEHIYPEPPYVGPEGAKPTISPTICPASGSRFWCACDGPRAVCESVEKYTGAVGLFQMNKNTAPPIDWNAIPMPRTDDAVEHWLIQHRDRFLVGSPEWSVIGELVNEYGWRARQTLALNVPCSGRPYPKITNLETTSGRIEDPDELV